jgi:hypothetical protein
VVGKVTKNVGVIGCAVAGDRRRAVVNAVMNLCIP